MRLARTHQIDRTGQPAFQCSGYRQCAHQPSWEIRQIRLQTPRTDQLSRGRRLHRCRHLRHRRSDLGSLCEPLRKRLRNLVRRILHRLRPVVSRRRLLPSQVPALRRVSQQVVSVQHEHARKGTQSRLPFLRHLRKPHLRKRRPCRLRLGRAHRLLRCHSRTAHHPDVQQPWVLLQHLYHPVPARLWAYQCQSHRGIQPGLLRHSHRCCRNRHSHHTRRLIRHSRLLWLLHKTANH